MLVIRERGDHTVSLSMRKLIMFCLTALIIVLFFFLRGDNSIVLELRENDAITLDGPQGTFVAIPYEDIQSVALLDSFDRGECINGGTKYKNVYGTWLCEAFGEYTLMARTKVDEHIAITDKDGQTLVFNYESNEVTENLYELILNLLEQQGISVGGG